MGNIVADRIARLGGIASTSELRAVGVDRTWLDLAVYYERVVRIRRGWFATWDVPEPARAAWRIGGRLACVSALELHGELLPMGGALHIEVPRGASRLRSLEGREVIVHWTRAVSGSSRMSVPLEVARSQAHRCRDAMTVTSSQREHHEPGSGNT